MKEAKKSLIVWFNLLQSSLPFPKPHGSFILSKSGQQSPALSQNSSQKHNALLTKSSIPQLLFRPLQQITDPPSSLLSQHCTDAPSSFCKQTLLAKVVTLNAMVMANTKERCFANSIAARPTRIVTVHLLPDVWNGITVPVLFTLRSEESRGRKHQMVWQSVNQLHRATIDTKTSVSWGYRTWNGLTDLSRETFLLHRWLFTVRTCADWKY